MSLVGSLEDLGLGEILQIVSLSGKSGVLWIRSPYGEGRILFDRGAIRGARIEGDIVDLRGLLAATGVLPETELEALSEAARSEGGALEEVVIARTSLDRARLDELRERHVEAVVLRMFSWPLGEFSFEVRDETAGGGELLLSAGINAQFLALEGARLRDENVHAGSAAQAEPAPESIPQLLQPIAEVEALDPDDAAPELEITVLELLDDADVDGLPPALELDPDEPAVDEDPTLSGDARRAQSALASDPVATAPPSAPAPACRAAVLIDPDLQVLEWAKSAIASLGVRAHIFPSSELGIQRIRQYFARGELPLVVLSTATPADSVSGARDWSEIAVRLRAQVPQLRLVLMAGSGENIVPANERGVPDAVATRPPASVLADERARERRDALGQELREAFATATRRPTPPRPAPARPTVEPLRVLRELSARLRDPCPPSEVLRLVLDFAAQHFDRSVVFWVRDGEAQAMAQRGIPAAAGGDAALRSLCAGGDGVAVFRKVFESRAPVHAAPEPADAPFFARLGAPAPLECFVAPVESGEQVAALLYADNAASGRPIGDTSAIEVVAHEASLALDRAVLERALEQVEARRIP